MRTDATLLRIYADARAEDAFAELVRRHLDGVYSAALRRVGGDSHLAQDVSQQVFVALARKAGSLVQHPSLTSWLYVTTRNEAANVVRSERRRKAREQESLAMQDAEASTVSAADWSRVSPVIDAAIDQLGEADRRAVLLRFVERRRFADIGLALNLSEDAARMRVERALEKLRGLMARRGIASSSGALGVALTQHAVLAAPGPLAAHVIGTVSNAAATSGIVATAASVFEFMTTAKILGGVAGLIAVVAGLGLAARNIESSRVAEAALNAATQRQAAAAARQRDAEGRLRLVQETTAELKQRLEEARQANAADSTRNAASLPPAKSASSAASDPRVAGDAFMVRHPQVKRAVNDYARARVDFRYAELYQKLGLTAGQIEQFRESMIPGVGMGASGAKGESMTLTSGDVAMVSGRNAQLETLLGAQGMKAFVDYAVWTEPARGFASQMAGALWSTDTPLTPSQADQLAQIMDENRILPVRGQRQSAGPFERFDWNAISIKAATVLSAPQLAALEGQRARDRFNVAMNRPASVPLPHAGVASSPAK